MRRIAYERTEFHGASETTENDLLSFVYDIPYFGACGIFPPFHILNQIFLGGGGDGGMGPGAIWPPFHISIDEYDELAKAISVTRPDELSNSARYCEIQYEFDQEFDHIEDYLEWLRAVCEKHRDNYHRKKGHC